MAERELRKLEGRLKEFKERHRGALPEQLDANLRTLDRLQLQLQNVNETLRSAEERRVFYEQQLEEQIPERVSRAVTHAPPNPMEIELEELKRELVRLQAQFHDSYPDIAVLKKRISEMEWQLAKIGTVEGSTEPSADIKPKKFSQTQVQLRILDTEISSFKQRRNQILNTIKNYEIRTEETYENELKILTIARDYNISKTNYESLLAKRLNAKMSENLEKRQKGEQFKVLDPANLPRNPSEPNRSKIILIGRSPSAALATASR